MSEQNKDHFLEKFAHTPPFSLGQKAFIVNLQGEVLVIRRAQSNTLSKIWDLPGGRLDYGETIREGLVREVQEEVGLTIEVIADPLNITTFFPQAKRTNQVIRIIYLCSANGNIVLSKEHEEYRWIDPQKYQEFNFPDLEYVSAFENYLCFKPECVEFIGKGMLEESITYRDNIE